VLRLFVTNRDAGIFSEVASDRGLANVSPEFCGEYVQFRVYVATKEPVVYVDSHDNDDFVASAAI
jgi:hypothetical protein